VECGVLLAEEAERVGNLLRLSDVSPRSMPAVTLVAVRRVLSRCGEWFPARVPVLLAVRVEVLAVSGDVPGCRNPLTRLLRCATPCSPTRAFEFTFPVSAAPVIPRAVFLPTLDSPLCGFAASRAAVVLAVFAAASGALPPLPTTVDDPPTLNLSSHTGGAGLLRLFAGCLWVVLALESTAAACMLAPEATASLLPAAAALDAEAKITGRSEGGAVGERGFWGPPEL
jgi:hypothetical protein